MNKNKIYNLYKQKQFIVDILTELANSFNIMGVLPTL